MKLMDVVVLGILAAGAYYIFTNPDAIQQITDLIGGLGGGLGGGLAPVSGGEDPCATECAAQTQAALAIGMDPEYFQFAYVSKKQSKSQKNGKEESSEDGGGEAEAEVGAGVEAGAEAGAAPTTQPCDCSLYTGGGETETTPGEDTGEADPMTGESSGGGEEEEESGGEEEEEDEDEEESSFARSYHTRRYRPQQRFRAYSGYGYAHKYAGWGNGHRVQPGYAGFIPRVH